MNKQKTLKTCPHTVILVGGGASDLDLSQKLELSQATILNNRFKVKVWVWHCRPGTKVKVSYNGWRKPAMMGSVIKNRSIFITGSGSGFGWDSAVALAERGHRVIATTHTEESAQKLKTFAQENNLNIESFKLDVTLPEDRQKILDCNVDVLLNNAGVGESGSLAEIPLDRVRHDFEVNVFGAIALTQLALQTIIPRDRGTILFVSSLGGRVTMPFLSSYSMTKFALCGGVDALRQEIRRVTKNVHVGLIEPGAYHTGFNQQNIAKQFVWMDESSYFFNIKDALKREQAKKFKMLEVRSTKGVVRQIVKACEAKRPKLRYTAPWWQALGVQLLRTMGK